MLVSGLRFPVKRYTPGKLLKKSTPMWFALVAFIFMYVGRQLGWTLSKVFLYPAPFALSVVGAVAWGIAVGITMSGLIGWLHPNAVFKWVLGFALGAYVAIPNYGLFSKSSIPDSEQPRHLLISNLPVVTYIITEFATKVYAVRQKRE